MQSAVKSTPRPETLIRVYLVEDHAMIRAAFRNLLARRPGVEIVGDSGDPIAAIAEISHLQPDIILLDITMPRLSGIDAIGRIRSVCPRSKVVMLTHHEGQTFLEQALRAGADGYLSKDSDEVELRLAIEAVNRGDPYISPRVAGSLVHLVRERDDCAEGAPSALHSLTAREREVFQLLATGMSNKDVARELGISLGTAKKHRENLQRKLDCHSAAELARLAIREGLLET